MFLHRLSARDDADRTQRPPFTRPAQPCPSPSKVEAGRTVDYPDPWGNVRPHVLGQPVPDECVHLLRLLGSSHLHCCHRAYSGGRPRHLIGQASLCPPHTMSQGHARVPPSSIPTTLLPHILQVHARYCPILPTPTPHEHAYPHLWFSCNGETKVADTVSGHREQKSIC